MTSTSGPAAAGPSEPGAPNLSIQTSNELETNHTKWWRWLSAPTPDGGLIGTYQASPYSEPLKRPSLDFLMRTLGRPFNDPDREAVLEGLYRKVKPIDSATPPPDP